MAILGHSHPAVTRAASDQLQRLNTNSRYIENAVRLRTKILDPRSGCPLDGAVPTHPTLRPNLTQIRFVYEALGGFVTRIAAAMPPGSGLDQVRHMRRSRSD